MSFRVKTTHPLLAPQQNTAEPAGKDKTSELLSSIMGKDYKGLTTPAPVKSVPTCSNSKGMSIRVSTLADSDHM